MELKLIIERVSRDIIVGQAHKHGSYYAYDVTRVIGKILLNYQKIGWPV